MSAERSRHRRRCRSRASASEVGENLRESIDRLAVEGRRHPDDDRREPERQVGPERLDDLLRRAREQRYAAQILEAVVGELLRTRLLGVLDAIADDRREADGELD